MFYLVVVYICICFGLAPCVLAKKVIVKFANFFFILRFNVYLIFWYILARVVFVCWSNKKTI